LRLPARYLRPFNLATLAAGVALLLVGARLLPAPDWDVGISLVMASFAYLTAGWSLEAILDRRWRRIPIALLWGWWTVDGCYALYWRWKDPAALAAMRDANWPASLGLYLACGVVWREEKGRRLAALAALLGAR
jgi:hypothetical protein